MADIFVSYAREDDGVAGALAYVFELEDWSCWWDREIRLGDDFRDVVADQIDSAAAVVVVWSPAARVSTWVKWEVARARNGGKLVELALAWPGAGAGEVVGGTLVISHRPHVPPIRDAVLARVADVGSLRRRCDGWNSRLRATAWRKRPPRRPIIAWEVVAPEAEDARIVRRERWVDTAKVEYGTTIGNLWMFGHEGEQVAIGWLEITNPEHVIQLPRPNRAAERRRPLFTVPFTVDRTLLERIGDVNYPAGGVDLAVDGERFADPHPGSDEELSQGPVDR